jgi:uncharacterized protein YndB with AHSA1/START domain
MPAIGDKGNPATPLLVQADNQNCQVVFTNIVIKLIKMTQLAVIQWPEHYKPGKCPIHVRNELDMAASPEKVWAWLTRATLWPSWYVNSSNVMILERPGADLKEGTRFRWKTFGVTIVSTVLEYDPNERIAWQAKAFGIDVYHAWLLQPSAKGCRVLTEETQHGWLAILGKLVMPNRMVKFHQLWLEALESKARTGLPPAA